MPGESNVGVSLFGATPKDKGVIRTWSRRVEQQIAIPIMNWFRWGPAKDLFKDRGAHAGLGNDSAAAQQLETVCRLTRPRLIFRRSQPDMCFRRRNRSTSLTGGSLFDR
jgi:hypothetical protein